MASHKQQMRIATERKRTEKQATIIDLHDTLHSIFWGVPTRDQLRPVLARLDKELASSRVDGMRGEILELGGKV